MTHFDHRSGKHLECRGAQLYVEQHGVGSKPALLLLHGGLGTIADFNPLLEALAHEHRVIGVDARGHGKSTLGAAEVSYESMQRDVEQVVQQLELKRFSVLGFSDGGIVALRLAASKRVPIDKLVVIGTPWQLRADDPLRAILAKVTPESWREKFPETYETYQALNPAPDFAKLVHVYVKTWLDGGASGYPQKTIRDVACETLVVRGDDDPLVSRATTFELVEQLPHARLLNVPFAGHEAHKDQPELIGRILVRFLAP